MPVIYDTYNESLNFDYIVIIYSCFRVRVYCHVVSFPSFVEDILGISVGTRSWDMMKDTWICTTKHPHLSISSCSRHNLSLSKIVKILVHEKYHWKLPKTWSEHLTPSDTLPTKFYIGILFLEFSWSTSVHTMANVFINVNRTLLSSVHLFMWALRI